MPTVPVYRTGQTFQAAGAPNFGALRQNTSGQQIAAAGVNISQEAEQAEALNKQRDDLVQKQSAAPVVASISPQMDLQLNDLLNNKKESMVPGGKGFASDYMQSAQPIYDKLMDGVDNPVARSTLSQMWQSHLATYGKQAQDLESGERIGYQVNQLGQGIQSYASLVNGDPSRYSESLQQSKILIDSSENLTPEARRKLNEQAMTGLTLAAADKFVEQDPASMVAWLTGQGPVQAGDSNSPRGISINNPTNIRRSNIPWQGKVAGIDQDFETFDSPVAGLRAGMINALNYQRLHGAKSVQDVVSRWAPNQENNTGAYIAGVANGMGVSPGSPIDLGDTSTLISLTKQLVHHENGQQPYSDDDYVKAANSAINGDPINSGSLVPSADPHASAPEFIQNLTPQQRDVFLDKARAQLAKQDSKLRSYVSGRVQDDTAAMLNGYAVDKPLSSAEIMQAYGDIDGPRVLRSYQAAQQTGQAVNRYATMTDQQIASDLEASRPQDGPGMADAIRDHDTRQRAAQAVSEQRRSDPVSFAANSGLANVNPINWASPTDAAAELKSRVGVAETMNQKYGT